MASKFYYWPDGDGELTKIDLGFFASECHARPIRSANQVRSGLGSVYTWTHGGGLSLKLMLEFGEESSVVRQMMALETFLKEGLPICFAYDSTYTYCSPLETEPVRGATYVDPVGSAFTALETDLVPTVGEVMMIQSPLPELRRELVTVSAVSATTGRVTFDSALVQSYKNTPVIIRSQHFYPYLVLAPGQFDQDLLTSNHGTDWVFNAVFLEDTAAVHNIEGQQVSSGHDGAVTTGALQDLGTSTTTTSGAVMGITGGPGF